MPTAFVSIMIVTPIWSGRFHGGQVAFILEMVLLKT